MKRKRGRPRKWPVKTIQVRIPPYYKELFDQWLNDSVMRTVVTGHSVSIINPDGTMTVCNNILENNND